jgi:uncharacterized protein YoxC
MSDDVRRIWAANAALALLVLAAAAITALLLIRTLAAANAINDDTDRIAHLSGGIAEHTDAVRKLERTNAIAGDILVSAKPLDGELQRIVDLSTSINGSAGALDGTSRRISATADSIDGTATQIDHSVGTIDTTAAQIASTSGGIHALTGRVDTRAGVIDAQASGINTRAAGILHETRLVDLDVLRTNRRVDDSIGLARTIFADTTAILDQAVQAHQNAACIDREIAGRDGADGHCDSLRDGSSP